MPCVGSEAVTAQFPDDSSPSETLQRNNILCNTHLYVILWLAVHASRAYAVHQRVQVLSRVYTVSVSVSIYCVCVSEKVTRFSTS